MAVFRDELRSCFPTTRTRKRLAQADVPLRASSSSASGYRPAAAPAQGARARPLPPQGDRRDRSASRSCWSRWARDRGAETGCCGMAGSFGFEADHYDVSMAAGERVLLPPCARASTRHARRRGRLLLPRRRSSTAHGGSRSILRRCSPLPAAESSRASRPGAAQASSWHSAPCYVGGALYAARRAWDS